MLRTVTSSSSTRRISLGPLPVSHPLLTCVRHSSSDHGKSSPHAGASAKLWADAMAEEAAEAQMTNNKPSPQPNEYPNWTGEESVQDAVLRMLVDKYKPLRGASIRTAEEKLKSTPPSLGPLVSHTSVTPSETPAPVASTSELSATVSPATHKPWLTTFRAPSHATSIRHMRLPPPVPPSARSKEPPIHPDDSRARIEQREKKKKAAYAGRLTNARESSLDYRLGKTVTGHSDFRMHRANPLSVKGWTSLAEERIERARSEGHFRSIKGRGKPIVRENEESNPFIPREEFLMNRIVQRQGAAPPWVEIQGGKPAAQLEAAVTSFRAVLRSGWTRRAVRILTLERPAALLPKLTLADVSGARMRDREWEAREAGYHEEALGEVNALVRKYNGVAPYTVRRNYLTRQAELDRMYEASGEDILAEVRRRIADRPGMVTGTGSLDEETAAGSSGSAGGGEIEPFRFSLRDMWNKWVAKLVRA